MDINGNKSKCFGVWRDGKILAYTDPAGKMAPILFMSAQDLLSENRRTEHGREPLLTYGDRIVEIKVKVERIWDYGETPVVEDAT
jgi:hypothetical protein